MYARGTVFRKIAVLSPTTLTVGIIGGELYLFTKYFFLHYLASNPLLAWLVSVIYYLFAALMSTSFIACVVTNPGDIAPSSETPEPSERYCSKCKINRPPRARHCLLCRRCVPKLDHHCPWLGNCIGLGNHKLFVLFCFYAAVSCLIEGIVFLPRVIQVFQVPEKV